MDLRVYKYKLKVTDVQIIKTNKIERVLSVKTQNDDPCIWAIVDIETEPNSELRIEIYRTGNPIDLEPAPHFLGSFILASGFVGHVFYQIVG